MVSPFGNSSILRNPANKNLGKFMTLPEFLDFAKAKAVSGILINIEVKAMTTLIGICYSQELR